MKRSILLFTVCILLTGVTLQATSLDEKLQSFGKENGKNYIQPFATAFGTHLNTGLYNTAKVKGPLHFGLTINTSAVMIPSSDQNFMATSPDTDIYTPNKVKTATIFGDKGGTFTGPADVGNLAMPDGSNLNVVPMAMPQVEIGLPFGSELMLRGVPNFSFKGYKDINFFGIGLKHDIDHYIPLCPVSIAVQGVYQQMNAGDAITVNDWAANLEVSKTFMMVTVYGGLQAEGTNLKASYTTKAIETGEGEIAPQKISFNIDGDNNFRATAGFRLRVLLFNINLDGSLSKYPAINLGLGMSI